MASRWPIEPAERIDDDHFIIIDDAEDAQDYCVVKGANAAKYATLISQTPVLLAALEELARQVAITDAVDSIGNKLSNLRALTVAKDAIKQAKGKQ